MLLNPNNCVDAEALSKLLAADSFHSAEGLRGLPVEDLRSYADGLRKHPRGSFLEYVAAAVMQRSH